MLIGEFESKVTDNNRISVPKKFREKLGENIVVTQGYEGCLILVDEPRFIALTKNISEGNFMDDAIRDTSRFLVGSAHEVVPDKQGRFVLPQSLKLFSEIQDEVVFLGLMRWVEIWDKDKWLTRKKDISHNSSHIAQKLSNQT